MVVAAMSKPMAAEIWMDCGNFMLAALNFYYTLLLVEILLKFYLYYTNTLFKCIFSDQPLIIVEL